MFGLTLRFRIISLTAVMAILLVTVFSALLLKHQLKLTADHNSYRARLGTFAAKGRLELALLSTIKSGDPTPAFQGLIPILKDSQLVDDITISDLEGKVIASANPDKVNTSVSSKDHQWSTYAQEQYSARTWYQVHVTPQEITFYTPVALEEKPKYMGIFRYSLGNMSQAIHQVRQLLILVALGVLAGIIPLCLLLIHVILGPIRILNHATKDIASGNLGLKVEVPTEDELGELAETFNSMTDALAKMKEKAENANPLTKLPGNNMIQYEIEKRIQEGAKFVAIYADLDNFKAFNDKYGIGVGDKVISLTAKILKEAVKKGSPTDFLGHEGGDDFVLVTSPDKSQAVADHITSEFDGRIRELYTLEDRQRGYITSRDREGNVKEFPIMTISLAGATNTHRKLTSYAQVTNIFAEVKKKAKMTSRAAFKSSFVVDRRNDQAVQQQTTLPSGSSPESRSS